ncbi:hypothetical protein THIOSC15_850002 [uncultured Thiomicrorhabdus sp.]
MVITLNGKFLPYKAWSIHKKEYKFLNKKMPADFQAFCVMEM